MKVELWNRNKFSSVEKAREAEATYYVNEDLGEESLALVTEVVRGCGAVLHGDEGAIWITEICDDE